MAGYALPSDTSYVSCSWQCHKNRPTPSSEPGTDYGVGAGHPLFAPGAGKVVDIKTTNSGATGRYLTIDLDDGRRTRSLHLASISVAVGQRVTRSQQVGRTGASGFGSDTGYGAHVHQTLWSTHAYNFCSTCTLDFANFVGSGAPSAGNQRTVGPNGANGRSEPKTTVPVTQSLAPGTVGDFNGWINGETVDGNKVWFHGAHSGDWFWSGGFTDKGTHDLENLNTVALTPTQRQAGENGANGRALPKTDATIQQSLAPGAIIDFAAWINGERIENNAVWFKVAGGPYFWSGGFTNKGVGGLTDINPQQPAAKTRTVGPNSSNGRSAPTTQAVVRQTLSANTVADMDAYTKGEAVSGNDVWFRGAHSGDWFWSGGFVGGANIEGLPLAAAPTPPNVNNPRGLVEYEPVNPNCDIGLVAPLGDGLRTDKGGVPVSAIIDRGIVHHCGTTVDQLDYFSWKNERSSCPNKYIRTNGWSAEMIRPGRKPASTGPNWNYRSYAWEVLDKTGAPTWEITDESKMEIALDMVWLVEHDGEYLDGVLVDLKLDRIHFIGHNEALPGTECPGPDMHVDAIVLLAQRLWEEKYPDVPPPIDPPDPPSDKVLVDRDFLEALNLELDAASETIDGILSE